MRNFSSGEHTRPAFADFLHRSKCDDVFQIGSAGKFVSARRRNQHAGRVCSCARHGPETNEHETMTSEPMRATVAEPQGGIREDVAEGSGRQTRDHRKTNRQRGRQRATSVLANAKSKTHQDVASRDGWRAGKVQALTRGDLPSESAGGVSRGHSSDDGARKSATAKGQRNRQQRSAEHCACGQNTPERQRPEGRKSRAPREPSPAGRCSRRNRGGEGKANPHRHA